MRRSRVHLLGASGGGTTTLARALADHWAVPHADDDDYFWVPTNPPYVEKRPEGERVALMQNLFVPREAWVLSGSMVGWGEVVVAESDAVVFLSLHPGERLRRLEESESRRRAGADYDGAAWDQFIDWAKGYDDPMFSGRSREGHEAWLATVDKPVLRLDSAAPVAELPATILAWDSPTSSGPASPSDS